MSGLIGYWGVMVSMWVNRYRHGAKPQIWRLKLDNKLISPKDITWHAESVIAVPVSVLIAL